MRTRLNVDDDVLQVAKQLAAQRGKTAGQVLSELARQALEPKVRPRLRNGVPVFQPGAKKPSLAWSIGYATARETFDRTIPSQAVIGAEPRHMRIARRSAVRLSAFFLR